MVTDDEEIGKQVDRVLKELINEGMIKWKRKDGEIVYSLTDKGKEYAEFLERNGWSL